MSYLRPLTREGRAIFSHSIDRELSSRRPRFALFLAVVFLLLVLLAPRPAPAEAGFICTARQWTDHPCFDNPLRPDWDIGDGGHHFGENDRADSDRNVQNDSDAGAQVPEGEDGRAGGDEPMRALDWPRSDDDRGWVCTVYELAFRARHAGRGLPASLRPYRGCSRWEHDFDFHNGGVLPRRGIFG